jgi:hypothetical protein
MCEKCLRGHRIQPLRTSRAALGKRLQILSIISSKNGNVTFRYVESRTGKTRCRTLKDEDFLWLVLQHVLPKGFRRIRDYGFLHGNARKLLSLVQMVLQVLIEARASRPRPAFKCPRCHAPMRIIAFRQPAWASG